MPAEIECRGVGRRKIRNHILPYVHCRIGFERHVADSIRAAHVLRVVDERAAVEDEVLVVEIVLAVYAERRTRRNADHSTRSAPVRATLICDCGCDTRHHFNTAGERLPRTVERECTVALLVHLDVAENRHRAGLHSPCGCDKMHLADGRGGVGYRTVAQCAGDGEGMSVQVNHCELVHAQDAARGPVRVHIERNVSFDVRDICVIVHIRESQRRGLHLGKKLLRHFVVHVPHAVLAHGYEIHRDRTTLGELRGVDARVAGIAGRSLVVEGEKIDAVSCAGRPVVTNRQIEGIAAAHLFDSPVAVVEMVENDVVSGVGGIRETSSWIPRTPWKIAVSLIDEPHVPSPVHVSVVHLHSGQSAAHGRVIRFA